MLRKKNIARNKNIALYDYDGNMNYNVIENVVLISDKLLEEKELKQELNRCINMLDIDEQQIIYLKYHCDFTFGQIANQMNIKEGTVKSKLHRAKKKISKQLQGYYDMKGKINNEPKY